MSQAAQTVLEPISRKVTPDARPGSQVTLRRVYAVNLMRSRGIPPSDFLSSIRWLGFDTLLLALPRDIGTADVKRFPRIVDAARVTGLDVYLDLRLDIAEEAGHSEWYRSVARRPAD